MSSIKEKFSKIYTKYGWKAAVGIFMYYLVRDVSLYIILPYLFINQFNF